MTEADFYCPQDEKAWDDFIDHSKNGTFMLKRGYAEYHADRFEDASVVCRDGQKIIAVMPASRHGEELRSHGGLTYGGIISDKKMTVSKMLEVFEVIKNFLKKNGFKKVLYKRVPFIYETCPSDEDLYALFRNGAVLVRRDVSTAVFLPDKIGFSRGKKGGVNKALRAGIDIKKFSNYDLFIRKQNEVLAERHGATAVHSADELKRLADAFPQNIELYGAFQKEELLAGTVIFSTPSVAHTQYIFNTENGREVHAFDLLAHELINSVYADKKYFDFGISCENNGMFLNEGLCRQKETFGARAVAYDFYEWNID